LNSDLKVRSFAPSSVGPHPQYWRRFVDDFRTLIFSDFLVLASRRSRIAELYGGAGERAGGILQFKHHHPLRPGAPVFPLAGGQDRLLTVSVPRENGDDSVSCKIDEIAPELRFEDQLRSRSRGQEPAGSLHTPQPDRSDFSAANLRGAAKAGEVGSKFGASIRDLLRKSPMKFKELYPIIAERHPEHCSGQGRIIPLASMAWLNEIQRDLQEIAVNRDGWWHLKETRCHPL
jgi:hypothetical protein